MRMLTRKEIIMNTIEKRLFKLQDKKYREMQVRIIPNIDSNRIIGVRTPELKNSF